MNLQNINNLGIDRVLRRESGEIILERDDALLVRDKISGAYMFACDDTESGVALLDRYIGGDCELLMVSDHALGMAAYERYSFMEKLECRQVAYYGKKPSTDTELSIRTADKNDLPTLTKKLSSDK